MKAALGIVALTLLLAPHRAYGYFENVAVDARAEAMGISTLAFPRGVSSYYWNPAGLAGLERTQILLDYSRPYAVPDLNVGALAIGSRWRGSGFALAWHRLAVSDVYAEDLFGLAVGREVPIQLEGHALTAGATGKWGRVGLQPFEDRSTGQRIDYGSDSRLSLDLGLRWTTPWKLDAAWVVRDLPSPRYRLIAGSDGGLVPRRHELALAYRWNRESTLTGGWSQASETGATKVNLGLEIRFFEVFTIRSGLTNVAKIIQSRASPSEFQFTGGFGVEHRGWTIDASAVTHRDLGASYRVSLLSSIPVGGRP